VRIVYQSWITSAFEVRFRQTVLRRQPVKGFIGKRAKRSWRIVLSEHPQVHSACLVDLWRARLDHHALLEWRQAGNNVAREALNNNKTHPARTRWIIACIVAKCRYIDANGGRGFKYRKPRREHVFDAVKRCGYASGRAVRGVSHQGPISR